MKTIGKFLVLLVGLAGCVTSPGLIKKGETLLIGQVIFSGSGFESWGDLSMNGIVHDGIDVIIEEIATSRQHIMRTEQYGLFNEVDLPAGQYKIKGFALKKTSGAIEAAVTYETPFEMSFGVLEGKVNNLGSFFWIFEYDVQNDLKYNGLHDDLMYAYKNDYPQSVWSKKDWVIAAINQELK